MKFENKRGATPIDPDTAEGLLLPLRTQRQLDEAEALNIESAILQLRTGPKSKTFPTAQELRDVHRMMFDQVWRWAGIYRTLDTNLGVKWPTITEHISNFCADTHARLAGEPALEELCAWFHWRLVSIHAFPNGNGRHSRLSTDLLRQKLGLPRWSWGEESLGVEGEHRDHYISALQATDHGDLQPLLAFIATNN